MRSPFVPIRLLRGKRLPARQCGCGLRQRRQRVRQLSRRGELRRRCVLGVHADLRHRLLLGPDVQLAVIDGVRDRRSGVHSVRCHEV